MTTIAYKDGVIAYDSRSCSGSTITDDDYEKCVERNGVLFWVTGCVSDIEDLISIYFGAEPRANIDCTALVWDGETLHKCSVDDNTGLWRETISMYKTLAMGSGYHHAWTAMDMGASAAQAVEMAMKRDTFTGGRVRTFKIPGFEPDRAILDYPVED